MVTRNIQRFFHSLLPICRDDGALRRLRPKDRHAHAVNSVRSLAAEMNTAQAAMRVKC